MEKNANFEATKQVVAIKPKSSTETAFVYRSINDVENLIKFVGKNPVIEFDNKKMVIKFKKVIVPDKSIVTRNEYGDITRVLPFEKAAEIFDIAGESDFKPEFENKLKDKVVKERKPKAEKK